MSKSTSPRKGLFQPFLKATAKAETKNETTPFSLRFTPEERAWLDEQAGHRPLGDYIRAQVLGDMARGRRVLRKPKIDDERLASVLGQLGQSRMASNLNQLAKQVNSGALGVSAEVEAELTAACAAVIAMRDELFAALGRRPSRQSRSEP